MTKGHSKSAFVEGVFLGVGGGGLIKNKNKQREGRLACGYIRFKKKEMRLVRFSK